MIENFGGGQAVIPQLQSEAHPFNSVLLLHCYIRVIGFSFGPGLQNVMINAGLRK
jgi:hypothetical protein